MKPPLYPLPERIHTYRRIAAFISLPSLGKRTLYVLIGSAARTQRAPIGSASLTLSLAKRLRLSRAYRTVVGATSWLCLHFARGVQIHCAIHIGLCCIAAAH